MAAGPLCRQSPPRGVRNENTEEASLSSHEDNNSRRDFLAIAGPAFAAVGGAIALWPFISQMNPDAGALALSSTEVDLAPIKEGAGDHRAVARQAGVHPPPHQEGDRGGARRRAAGAARSGERCRSRPRRAPSSGSCWSASAPTSAASPRARRLAT